MVTYSFQWLDFMLYNSGVPVIVLVISNHPCGHATHLPNLIFFFYILLDALRGTWGHDLILFAQLFHELYTPQYNYQLCYQ